MNLHVTSCNNLLTKVVYHVTSVKSMFSSFLHVGVARPQALSSSSVLLTVYLTFEPSD